MFSGRNDDWLVWSARFGAYAELAGWAGVLEVAEAQTAAVRVAPIMDHALDAVKSMLRLSLLEERRSVDALKLWIRESRYATPGLFQGSMPMQVGAVSDGGKGKKGKSESTGDKGKGKGNGKDKNKHKSNDGDKTKGRDYWNSGQQRAQFQGYCSHCSKWGHKTRRLSNSIGSTENYAVAGVQEPESETEGVTAAQWSDVDSEDVDMDSSSW